MPTPRSEKVESDVALQMWKHYQEAAGGDKDRMITVVTWLLGFSSVVAGLRVSDDAERSLSALLPVMGVLVSALAVFVAVMYGGYAARNWFKATVVAEAQGLPEPEKEPCGSGYPDRVALWMSQPCTGRVAPVFWFFASVSLISAIAHAVVLWT